MLREDRFIPRQTSDGGQRQAPSSDHSTVSVIVRTRNRLQWLRQALDSIAAQTYRNLEVIVVNDGGQDVNDIIQSFQNKRIQEMRYLVLQPGRGRSEAANLGLQRVSGEYLAFLDDDDWFDPGHIAGLLCCLQTDTRAIAAYAGVRCLKLDAEGCHRITRIYNEPYDPVKLMLTNFIPVHAMLFRRTVIENEPVCRFDERLDLFEDWDFWLQLQRHGHFAHLDAITANYRIHAKGGLGVEADQNSAVAALRSLIEKWQSQWSTQQMMEMIARARHLYSLLQSQEEERDKAQKQLIEVADRAQNLDTTLRSAETRRSDLEGELEMAREALNHRERELADLQSALDAKTAEAECIDRQWRERYELLTSSRSWRLTAPLRTGADSIRSLKSWAAEHLSWRARLWQLAMLLYRSHWGRGLMSRIPFSWKQYVRGYLRRGTEIRVFSESQERLSDEPWVSILIPVYNHAQYLEQCIRSALKQSYPYVEVIAIDDASPDPKVREILMGFSGNERLQVFFNDTNLGISCTQNRALIESRGNIIGFLDCDDYLSPDAVERCLHFWNKDTIYLHTGRINVDDKGEEVNRISFEHLPRKDYFEENFQAMYATHFKLIRREVFARIGLFDPRFDSAQDYDLLMRIAFHYSSAGFVHVPEFVYYHRFHSQQATELMSKDQGTATRIIKEEANLRRAVKAGEFDRFISFIMLSFGKHRQTLKAVASLQETIRIPHEIILFENGSDAETVEFIRGHIDGRFPNVRVIYNSSNLGPAVGRREALEHARGDWFVIFDNDELAEPGWLEELLVRALSLPDVGAVCCKVLFPNGQLQFSGGYIEHLDHELIELKLYDRDRDAYDLSTAVFHECGWCPIGATLFTVNPAEFLHEGYPNVFEDAGVSMALRRIGKRLLNSPASWVWHEHFMFCKQVDMRRRYVQSRYDPRLMLISMATFYRENRLIIQDEYVWRENRLFGLSRVELKELLEHHEAAVQTGVI